MKKMATSIFATLALLILCFMLFGQTPSPPLQVCVGSPGNTAGVYRQQCLTSGNAVWVCTNAAGCTVAGDWVATSGSVSGFTAGAGTLTGPGTSGTVSATPGANVIPQAGAGGAIASGFLPTLSTTVNGKTCTLGSSCSLTAGEFGTAAYIAGGGSAQAQTVTLSPAVTSLVAGLTVRWLPTAANTAAGPTLAVNGLTATTITKCGTTALVANDLTTTAVATATYDGTRFQLVNPQAVACASAAATNPGLFSNLISIPTRSTWSLTSSFNTQGTFTQSDNSVGFTLFDSAGAGADHLEGIYGAYPTPPFTYTFLMSRSNTGATNNFGGLSIQTSSSGKSINLVTHSDGHIYVLAYNSPGSFNGQLGSASIAALPYYWGQLIDDGTNITLAWSYDGVTWEKMYGPVTKASSFLGSSGFVNLGYVLNMFTTADVNLTVMSIVKQ